jgi:hypothetical protein
MIARRKPAAIWSPVSRYCNRAAEIGTHDNIFVKFSLDCAVRIDRDLRTLPPQSADASPLTNTPPRHREPASLIGPYWKYYRHAQRCPACQKA